MKSQKLIIFILIIISLTVAGFLTGFYFKHKSKNLPEPTVITDGNFHYSYFSQPQFFDQAYADAQAQNYQPTAKAILVNHHLLASKFIAESFSAVATDAPLTVLLISPNHFSTGKGEVITSSEIWQTPYGELPADEELENRLVNNQLASVEEDPFGQEHGISGIVPFIKKSLPNAKVVPLIIRDNLPIQQARKIAQGILPLLPANTLIVGSFDFSHYLTAGAADFHDVESLSVVENFDYDGISRLDADSHPGLAMFLQLLDSQNAKAFSPLEHGNSAEFTQQEVLETTSYIDGYFTPGLQASSAAATLLALGNVENSAAVENSLKPSGPNFSIEYLQRLLFGQQQTVVRIQASSGLPSNLKIDGVNTPITGNQTLKLGNKSVAFIDSQKLADLRAAIDSGADVAIGNSQTFKIESYKNKLIFYGVGDFLTSRTLQQTSISLALGFALQNHNLSIYLLPIGFTQSKGKLLIGKESSNMLTDMANNSAVSETLKQQIKTGKLQLIINK